MKFITYDIESYPNFFSCTMKNKDTGNIRCYEISDRKNEAADLISVLYLLGRKEYYMVGFRNTFYDYPMLHYLINEINPRLNGGDIANLLYKNTVKLIEETKYEDRYSVVVWPRQQVVRQIDLQMIHHFDNRAKMTSLKVLEFNMRLDKIEELPFAPNTVLNSKMMDKVISYNAHDVEATEKFLEESIPHIEFREYMSESLGLDLLNSNDVKIGTDFFIKRLEQAGAKLYDRRGDGKKTKRQTKRSNGIAFSDIILDYVEFDRPEFNAVLSWMKRQVVKKTKGAFTCLPPESLGELAEFCDMRKKRGKVKDLNVVVDGFKLVYGQGGLHGSINKSIIKSDDNKMIMDIDVVSQYPSNSIENDIYPAHIGPVFCKVYKDLKVERLKYAKATRENKALKFALNGSFGNTNCDFSVLFDPQCTMAITLAGQLSLSMIIEKLLLVPKLMMIQANTDGVTFQAPRKELTRINDIIFNWQVLTGLVMETAFYDKMFIRDVNNYIGLYEDGSTKLKGAYEYKREHHKNWSQLIVPRAAEANLVHRVGIGDFLRNQDNDPYDFFIRTKVPRNSRLELVHDDGHRERVQNVSRYYVATTGPRLVKVMPPLKGKTEEREIRQSGFRPVAMCNTHKNIDFDKLDWSWYEEEAKKLVKLKG